MSFNQQLREPRVLAILNPRVIALMAFVAAALIGCRMRIRASAASVSAYIDAASGVSPRGLHRLPTT